MGARNRCLGPRQIALEIHPADSVREVAVTAALGAFAGMRTSAIGRLDFAELDFGQRGILTPACKTKKRRRQWIDGLPENLWKWLERTLPEIFALDGCQLLHRRESKGYFPDVSG